VNGYTPDMGSSCIRSSETLLLEERLKGTPKVIYQYMLRKDDQQRLYLEGATNSMKPIGGDRKVAGDVDDGLTFVIEQNFFR
jgi:hypothetical protein